MLVMLGTEGSARQVWEKLIQSDSKMGITARLMQSIKTVQADPDQDRKRRMTFEQCKDDLRPEKEERSEWKHHVYGNSRSLRELHNIFLKYGLPQTACNEILKVTGDVRSRTHTHLHERLQMFIFVNVHECF
jgi:hypothetical protein